MYRIAVIGDRDSIYGFAALGLDIYPVEYGQDASEQLKTLCNGEYAVIYITEALLKDYDRGARSRARNGNRPLPRRAPPGHHPDSGHHGKQRHGDCGRQAICRKSRRVGYYIQRLIFKI